MKCPHCEVETELPEISRMYIARYHTDCTVAMPCCGVGVVLRPVTKIQVQLYKGDELQDDWGHDIFTSEKTIQDL